MNRLSLIAVILLNGIALGFGWKLITQRHLATIAQDAIPPIPRLNGLPRIFEDRVRLDTAAASRTNGRPLALEELAMLYHANGFSKEAEKIERSLQKLEPEDPRWPYYLADLRLVQGDAADAENFLLSSLRMDPRNAAAELKLGNLLLRTGRSDEAISHYTKRLAELPSDPYARLGLARAALLQDHMEHASALLKELLQDSPNFYTAHNLLAEISESTGNVAEAMLHRQLGSSSPRFHDAEDPMIDQIQAWSYDPYQLQVRGAINMQSGKLLESLPFYEKAVRLNPQDGTGYDALGDVLLQLGRLDEAKEVLETGISTAPKLYSLYVTLAQVVRKQGQPGEAIEVLTRAVATLPTSPEIRNDLGVALDDAGLHSEASVSYREAIRLNPAFAEAHLNLGLCLEELGITKEAEAHFRVALELRPGNRGATIALAKADFTEERWDAGRRRLELLLTVDSGNRDALNLIAIVHLHFGLEADKAGRIADAESEFQAGLSADPDNPELQANEGIILTQRGDVATAIGYFQRFVSLKPEDPTSYLYLGQALIVANRFAEARKVLSQGLGIAVQANDISSSDRLRAVLQLAPQQSR